LRLFTIWHLFTAFSWPSNGDQDRVFRCLAFLICSVHRQAAFVLSTQMNSVQVGVIFYNVMHESESMSRVNSSGPIATYEL